MIEWLCALWRKGLNTEFNGASLRETLSMIRQNLRLKKQAMLPCDSLFAARFPYLPLGLIILRRPGIVWV